MDFIFGTLASDDLRLVHHRATLRGLQHNHDLSPRDPTSDTPVIVTVYTGADFEVDHVACYYTTDGSLPAGAFGTAENGKVILLKPVEVEWDTLAWGYRICWRGMLPIQAEGTTVRYQIGAWCEGCAEEIFADCPQIKATTEAAAVAFFRGEPLPLTLPVFSSDKYVFSYHVDRLTPPQWAKDAVIYHIFLDRFYHGDGKDWLQTDDLNQFFGGTLWGVIDKLDYLQELGINCLWLSPPFVSPTPHGYDIVDFEHIEDRLGGDEALKQLVEAAHKRGIRVLLDLVCNHMSDRNAIFIDAKCRPNSPYREWFYFDDSEIGYRTFFGVPSMPQINAANPAVREWLIDIGRYWLREFDVDGFRLDHANGPGADFWTDFWVACKEEKPDCYCFGEVVDAPDVQVEYVGRLDGILDFHLADMMRKTFALKEFSEQDFNRFVTRHMGYFPSNFLMPTFLDNHDMNRFLFLADGDKMALRQAASYQMRLPNPPIIYYGTEVGLNQRGGVNEGFGLEVSREAMIWDDGQDKELFAFYQTIIRQRNDRIEDKRLVLSDL